MYTPCGSIVREIIDLLRRREVSRLQAGGISITEIGVFELTHDPTH